MPLRPVGYDEVVVRLVADVVSVVVSSGLVAWGIWLLATPDPDGGRHPAGVVMLTAGVVVGVWAALGARRRVRQLRTPTSSRAATDRRL
jgi:hypothetical protein